MVHPELYHTEPNVSLFCGDARKVAPRLEKVDMILIDPPYGETAYDWDRWPEGWVEVARQCLKPSGSMWCTGSFRMFMEHSAEFFASFQLAQDIVWEKHNGSNMRNDRFRRVHELAVQFFPQNIRWGDLYINPIYVMGAEKRRVKRQSKPAHWDGIGNSEYQTEVGGPLLMKSVIYARSMAGRTTVSVRGEKNGTQKPFDLLAPLIEYSCPPGGTVLDMTCGAGSTISLALRMDRKAIGIDTRPGQCELTKQRLYGGPLFMEWEAENEPPLNVEEEQYVWNTQTAIQEQLGLFGEEAIDA